MAGSWRPGTAASWPPDALSRGLTVGQVGEPRRTAEGRVLPTPAVGYAVAQLGGQLSGREFAHPTGAGRPFSDIDSSELYASKQSIGRSLGRCQVQARVLALRLVEASSTAYGRPQCVPAAGRCLKSKRPAAMNTRIAADAV